MCAVSGNLFQPSDGSYRRKHCWPWFVHFPLLQNDSNAITDFLSFSKGDAVVNVYINHEKKFAFVEMRSVEEASNAMALDGIIFEVHP